MKTHFMYHSGINTFCFHYNGIERINFCNSTQQKSSNGNIVTVPLPKEVDLGCHCFFENHLVFRP